MGALIHRILCLMSIYEQDEGVVCCAGTVYFYLCGCYYLMCTYTPGSTVYSQILHVTGHSCILLIHIMYPFHNGHNCSTTLNLYSPVSLEPLLIGFCVCVHWSCVVQQTLSTTMYKRSAWNFQSKYLKPTNRQIIPSVQYCILHICYELSSATHWFLHTLKGIVTAGGSCRSMCKSLSCVQ